MKLDTYNLTTLATALAAGTITEDFIREQFGDSVLSSVLALGAGGVAGAVVGSVAQPVIKSVLDSVDEHTGLVSMADDVISSLNPFKW